MIDRIVLVIDRRWDRCTHPELYHSIRKVRLSQLAERYKMALENAKTHSRNSLLPTKSQ